MAQVRLPRLLESASKAGLKHEVEGEMLTAALSHLFASEPALQPHLLDEHGNIREHVLIFVDGSRANLQTSLRPNSEIRVIQAVSGG